VSRGSFDRTNVNGISVAYRRWPPPSPAVHPATILLHGALQTGEGMRHLADRLAVAGEVLVPDLRGRGATDRPGDGYDPATIAEDVAALIEELAVWPAVVIGRLHGGLVAYQLAARRPDLVLGLIIGDSTPEVSAERAAREQARLAAIPRTFASSAEAERFYVEGLRLSPARARHDLPSDLEQMADGTLTWRHDLDVIAKIEAMSSPRSDWGVLARIKCPVLILRGQRGEIRQEIAERMVETMREARCHTVLGAGHDVFLGPGAEQSLAAIQLFLRELAAAQ
jgi:pimeloyl-ACP methyl ester carboxylesterase